MTTGAPRRIIVAGAGIAGLTAALAFAARGFPVRVLERAPRLEEVGAGIQLSPNATRLLRRLGALDLLKHCAVRPDAVVLRDGTSLAELARIPLGDNAETRWGAPYLVAHRSDLQDALLARVAAEPSIDLQLNAQVRGVTMTGAGITPVVEGEPEPPGQLLVGADGVHSAVRRFLGGSQPSFGGEIAWRATLGAESPEGEALRGAASFKEVTAFLRPGFHLIAYPVRGGSAINIAAFTKGAVSPNQGGWYGAVDRLSLSKELSRCAPALRELANLPDWTFWPIYRADDRAAWTHPHGVALIGDAAHAMTPYAAQGAAMAMEDAVILADRIAERPDAVPEALSAWERERRPRIVRVKRRAALNRLAWHATGPIAIARNLVLRLRGGDKLAADMDWLYGYRSE